MKCHECKYIETRGANEYCTYHDAYVGWQGCEYGEPKPPTNADRLRSMSDEELAEWIASILSFHGALCRSEEFDFDRYCIECPLNKCCNDNPSGGIEDWLKAPA